MSKVRPDKPYPEFPLTAHPCGQWCKKIRGRLRYFGPWADWQAALDLYCEQRDDLHAGRNPKRIKGGVTLGYALDHFLSSKKNAHATGELSERSFREHVRTCERISLTLGNNTLLGELDPSDLEKLRLELGKGFRSSVKRGRDKAKKRKKLKTVLSPTTVKGELTRARMVLLHINENLAEKPIVYRKALRSPSRRSMRQVANERGDRSFSREEIKTLLADASPQLTAMIYLGINCGFGNSDCATLSMQNLDLPGGWHNYWRPKTQNPRRCPLWPETVRAIRESFASRPEPRSEEFANLVFLTREGRAWSREDGWNAVSTEFRKLMKDNGIYRPRVNGFYSLRRTFETVATDAGHQVAVDFIMGHCPANDDMAAVYRQRISDEALQKVTDFVRAWFTKKT
ncbi:tyrosine-type recombinase/integrase [Anatilimnocola sp. NA78]|uniref:tyrosine-type recombinase/integrase n=1 Tax=Anatilimnocola sp. NA78 TaxID=3415683 RepID=UPI003CE5B503